MQPSDYRYVERTPSQESGANQTWDVTDGGRIVARADVYFGESQWGVRLTDDLPTLDVADLLRLAAHILVWECGCRADTVDVVLGRDGQHYPLIRTGPDYV
ncbi:MAG: hypothetical protein R3B40_00750 [Polyangiales bacterium]|nr:hypothetical protein [Myxococcales bacterium]MCB9659027.1 hypothetical protein [Sandaracinaceae bacterium]